MVPFSIQKTSKGLECEDSQPIATVDYSIVCDGLGGSGGKTVSINGETHTNAWFGARIVSSLVERFYLSHKEEIAQIASEKDKNALAEFSKNLKDTIVFELEAKAKEYNIEKPTGRTAKVFPTTLASAIYFEDEDRLTIIAIWAGDSRVYFLGSSSGLKLLSEDDAYDNREHITDKEDSLMSNLIYAFGNFSLNYALYEFNEPGIAFCCSDGCFEYLPYPPFFEMALEDQLRKSIEKNEIQGIEEIAPVIKSFENGLSEEFYATIYDDTTMGGAFYSINNAKEAEEYFHERTQSVINQAEEIFPLITEWQEKKKKIQEEKIHLQRTTVEMKNNLQSIVFDAMESKDETILRMLKTIEAYKDYERKEEEEERNLIKEKEALRKKKEREKEEKKSEIKEIILTYFLRSKINENSKGDEIDNLRSNIGTFVEMIENSDSKNDFLHVFSIMKETFKTNLERLNSKNFSILKSFYQTSRFKEKRELADYEVEKITSQIMLSKDAIPDFIPIQERVMICKILDSFTPMEEENDLIEKKHEERKESMKKSFWLLSKNSVFETVLPYLEKENSDNSLLLQALGMDYEKYRTCKKNIEDTEADRDNIESMKNNFENNIRQEIKHIDKAYDRGSV